VTGVVVSAVEDSDLASIVAATMCVWPTSTRADLSPQRSAGIGTVEENALLDEKAARIQADRGFMSPEMLQSVREKRRASRLPPMSKGGTQLSTAACCWRPSGCNTTTALLVSTNRLLETVVALLRRIYKQMNRMHSFDTTPESEFVAVIYSPCERTALARNPRLPSRLLPSRLAYDVA
jgi:hypothetical protein